MLPYSRIPLFCAVEEGALEASLGEEDRACSIFWEIARLEGSTWNTYSSVTTFKTLLCLNSELIIWTLLRITVDLIISNSSLTWWPIFSWLSLSLSFSQYDKINKRPTEGSTKHKCDNHKVWVQYIEIFSTMTFHTYVQDVFQVKRIWLCQLKVLS